MSLVPVTIVDRARSGAKQFASGFTSGQKAVTIAAVVAAIIGAVVMMSMTGKPSYAPLFTNVQPADAASITSKLASAKIPYQLANGGTTIMVPANDVNQERIVMAQAGLPSGGTVGLSLLDKEGITTSNMTQQADYLRALQGELEQTIDSIAGVASSQVNIALPANQNFALTNSTPTGASVMVSMQQGQTLDPGEVQAIVHLVASSIPNLDSKNVTVADSTGDLLAGPGVSADLAGGGGSQTNAYDASVAQKVQAYLASVVGAGNADVQVNASLDFSQVSTTTNTIMTLPNGKPASFCTQQSNTKETYTGSGAPPGGAAGTITATAGGTGTYSNTQTSQTCETSQQTQTVQQAPGTLKSEQVAVLLNSAALPKGVNLSSLKAGVAAAAGINTARGDQLAFSTMPFNSTSATQAAAAAKAVAAANKSKAMDSLIKTAVVFLVIGLVLFLLWRSARKARITTPTVLGPTELEALQAARDANRTAMMPAVQMPEISPAVETVALSQFIDNQPDEVATMLRTWLQDQPGRVQA